MRYSCFGFDGYKLVTDNIDKINDKIEKVNEEVKNAILGIGNYKEIPKEDRKELIAKLESQLTKLESQLTKLEADKEWLKKRIEEQEKKRGIFQEIYDARIERAHSDFYSRSNKESNRRRVD